MKLEDIKTLKEVAEEHGIIKRSLMNRFRVLVAKNEIEESKDYRKTGSSILLTPKAVEKLVNKKK
ncbi:MAG: hypothetical protein LIR50_19285 [Bacillota bacterium]|nr:hypothetical protein [Bacillota bacterium]